MSPTSNYFFEHDDEFTVLKWQQSKVLGPNERLCHVVEREIHIVDMQAKKSATTAAMCCHVGMDQNVRGTFPAPC